MFEFDFYQLYRNARRSCLFSRSFWLKLMSSDVHRNSLTPMQRALQKIRIRPAPVASFVKKLLGLDRVVVTTANSRAHPLVICAYSQKRIPATARGWATTGMIRSRKRL